MSIDDVVKNINIDIKTCEFNNGAEHTELDKYYQALCRLQKDSLDATNSLNDLSNLDKESDEYKKLSKFLYKTKCDANQPGCFLEKDGTTVMLQSSDVKVMKKLIEKIINRNDKVLGNLLKHYRQGFVNHTQEYVLPRLKQLKELKMAADVIKMIPRDVELEQQLGGAMTEVAKKLSKDIDNANLNLLEELKRKEVLQDFANDNAGAANALMNYGLDSSLAEQAKNLLSSKYPIDKNTNSTGGRRRHRKKSKSKSSSKKRKHRRRKSKSSSKRRRRKRRKSKSSSRRRRRSSR